MPPWILESAEEELLEGPIFPNNPDMPKAEAPTLLLVKYCLRGGNAVAVSRRSLERRTTWMVVRGRNPRGP